MAFKMTSPLAKVRKVKSKGGGTKKVCLPKAKIASMSKAIYNYRRSWCLGQSIWLRGCYLSCYWRC